MIEFTSPRRDQLSGGWTRNCRVDGVEYCVSILCIMRIRGHSRGWSGSVYSGGHCLWSGNVPKSLGVRGLLAEAGVL